MTTDTQDLPALSEDPAQKTDNAKYRQILAGARKVFRAKGFDGASMEVIAKEAGVSNYIVKPFNAETLKSKLVSVLGEF